jgi:hypothetical protein
MSGAVTKVPSMRLNGSPRVASASIFLPAVSDPDIQAYHLPFHFVQRKVTFEMPHLGNRTVELNTEGMIHIGLLPELIEDARRDGLSDADLEPLFRSAEAYVRMWEHAEERAKALKP